MDEQENGVAKLPAIELAWDEATHRLYPRFNAADFKTFEFVVALLDMAKGIVLEMRDQARAQSLHQQMQQQMMAQQNAAKIRQLSH